MILTGVVSTRSGKTTITLDTSGYVQEVDLQNENSQIFTMLAIAWACLLSDSPLSNTDGYKPKREYNKLLNFLAKGRSSIKYYSNLYDELLSSTSSHQSDLTIYPIPEIFKTPVGFEYIRFLQTGDPELLSWLLAFFSFGKKVEFVDPAFIPNALRNWKIVEERISKIDYSNINHVRAIRSILHKLLPTEMFSNYFLGKHGSGAVAGEERGVREKNENFYLHPKLMRFLSFSQIHGKGQGSFEDTSFSKEVRKQIYEEDEAVIKFVAKDAFKVRSICMEPTPFMFFQQHVRMCLEKNIKDSIFGRYIDINDQGRNRSGALYGSASGDVDTIDLSAASDSVSVRLVKEIFPRQYLHPLLSTRTSQARLPNGESVKVDKFAPMGSALCFPVQTLIYSSIVMYAYLHIFGSYSIDDIENLTTSEMESFFYRKVPDTFTSSLISSFVVYGDDIICDVRSTYFIMEVLSELGFSVNFEKSFTGDHAIRESCGLFAFNGNDITFYRFKQKFFSNGFNLRSIYSLVALANIAGDYGHRHVQRFLIHFSLNYCTPRGVSINPIKFSNRRNESFTFYSKAPRNSHLRSRPASVGQNPDASNVRYQRDEVKHWYVESKKENYSKKEYRFMDSYNYHMFNRANALSNSQDDSFIYDNVGIKNAKMGWRWTPAH